MKLGSSEGTIIVAAVVLTIFVVIALYHSDTDVSAYPVGYESYRQPLYWGENTFYFPRTLAGTTSNVRVEFTGYYNGSFERQFLLPE